jgi:hypothetical protein
MALKKYQITEITVEYVHLLSDGAVNVLRDYFARSYTTLTKVTLADHCSSSTTEETSQLLAAFETNRTVSNLTIRRICSLQGGALGACLCGLSQNMPQLLRLECSYSILHLDGVRALQP